MNGLLTMTGNLSFDSDTDPAVLPHHLANSLHNVKASTVEIQGSRVMFTRRMFRFVSNWNVLAPFESGELEVDAANRQLHYHVHFRQLALIGTGMVAAMAVFMLATPAYPRLFLVFIPVMWLWLVGANLAIGICRFRQLLRFRT